MNGVIWRFEELNGKVEEGLAGGFGLEFVWEVNAYLGYYCGEGWREWKMQNGVGIDF